MNREVLLVTSVLGIGVIFALGGLNDLYVSVYGQPKWNEMNIGAKVVNGNLESDIKVILPKFNMTSHDYFKECEVTCDCTSEYDTLGVDLIYATTVITWIFFLSFYRGSSVKHKAQVYLTIEIFFFLVLFYFYTKTFTPNTTTVGQNINPTWKPNRHFQVNSYTLDDEFLSIPIMLKIPTKWLSTLCRSNVCHCGISPKHFIPFCILAIAFGIADMIKIWKPIITKELDDLLLSPPKKPKKSRSKKAVTPTDVASNKEE